jgi:hypothetical protein
VRGRDVEVVVVVAVGRGPGQPAPGEGAHDLVDVVGAVFEESVVACDEVAVEDDEVRVGFGVEDGFDDLDGLDVLFWAPGVPGVLMRGESGSTSCYGTGRLSGRLTLPEVKVLKDGDVEGPGWAEPERAKVVVSLPTRQATLRLGV